MVLLNAMLPMFLLDIFMIVFQEVTSVSVVFFCVVVGEARKKGGLAVRLVFFPLRVECGTFRLGTFPSLN